MRFLSILSIATFSPVRSQYADQSKMTEKEKHAYWDELLEIRRLRDKDPTQLTIGEVAMVAQYYEDIREWLHNQKTPQEMDKFYDRLDARKKRRDMTFEEKRLDFRERVKNITEAFAEAEDEYEVQKVWDVIYPDKVPYAMRASNSEWANKKNFRERAEKLKKEQQGKDYKPSFLISDYPNPYPNEEKEMQEAEDELFRKHYGNFDGNFGNSYDENAYNDVKYQDPDDEEEVMAEDTEI